ncbi:uncharacterized protein M6B38_174360 [Iris pallida]|uniref:Protein LNK2 n=1 Tax=Iris pallida TaxID=29817 RepID=A0AAX6ERF6_IRIPA|nr:uncharacterized protein M6B38_174360 [Iris pallida]
MFDWNDQDQVGDTIWGESNGNEDHIVPYSKDSEDNTIFSFGDYQKKQENDDAGASGRSTEQTSGVKNEFPRGSLENCSSFNTDEEISAPGLDLDAWPDLPSLNLELSKGYTDASDHDSLLSEEVTGNMTEFVISNYNVLNFREIFIDVSCSFLAGCTAQLDGEPELFGNENEDKESNNFLDCDWSNIGDFDDLDRIFRNDSIFGHDMVTDVDDFLSQSTDVIGSTAQSIPLPDLPASRDLAPDQDCSSNQLIDRSGKETEPEVKASDRTVDTTEKTIHRDQLSEREDRKEKLLKSRKKAEERSKNKAVQNINGSWPQSISQQFQNPVVQPSLVSPLHRFRPPAIRQQSPIGGAESTGHLGCSNQIMFSHYGYPPYPFPGIPVVSHAQAEDKHRKTVAVGRKFYPDSLEHLNISNKIPELHSRQLSMTPQEKIEKLRRRQQVQAMLAIQQQQQQFSHQMTGTAIMASQGNSQKNQTPDAVKNNMGVEENQLKLPSSDMNILMDYDESQNISALIDDNSLEETIYYQLQDALRKVDIRVRLCIRDSLFRLAQSSMERQSAIDRSSTNRNARDEEDVLGNEEKNLEQSHTSLPDAETYTNPIDRTVAHLLFHKPSEQSIKPLNTETPQSPTSNYKLPRDIRGSISKEQPESYGEMEVQPSPQN